VEQGGRIRISVLFRPVSLKSPQSLLGFDTGAIGIRKITVKTGHNDLNLTDCELRLRTSTSSEKEKITHKQAEKGDAGEVSWLGSNEIHLPIRQRYSSALFITFKSGGGLTDSRRKAFAVLWMRDLIDNEATKVEIALWTAKSNDYSRLRQNYVPPDGDLKSWDSDKDTITRIGSVWLDVTFIPGVSDVHRKMLSGADAKKRGAWEEFVREKAGGFREDVGARECEDGKSQGKGSSSGAKSPDLSAGEGVRSGTAQSGDTPSRSLEPNSTVPQEEAVVEDEAEEQKEADGDESSDDDKGWRERWHKWREEEEELHRGHRGIMQRKPARTAAWLKDSVEMAGHKVKDRFSHQGREPDVETEV